MIKQISFFKSHIRKLSYFFFYLGVCTGLLYSCKDAPYEVGLDLLPAEDHPVVEQVDTLTLNASTIGPVGIPAYDSINFPFGNYNDPVFGRTSASVMFELSPASAFMEIDPGFMVDTVTLNIYYTSIYGDTLYQPQFEVYRLTERIDKTLRYYSDYDPIGKYDFENLAISPTEKPDTTNRFAVRLNPSFGTDLLNTPGLNDSMTFINYRIDSIFDANFKGLYLKPTVNNIDTGILNIDYISLIIKFHTATDTTLIAFYYYPYDNIYADTDSTTRTILGDRCIKIFDHDYSGSGIAHLNDNSYQDTVLYLQTLGGTQINLEIPNLEQLKEKIGRVSVNSAELFIPDLSDSSQYLGKYPFYQLGLRIVGDGLEYVSDDVITTSTSSYVTFMDGRLNPYFWGYKFILTAYIQNYMNGNITSNKLRIFAGRIDLNPYVYHTNFDPTNYKQVILAGTANTNKKITFKIAYTKLDN